MERYLASDGRSRCWHCGMLVTRYRPRQDPRFYHWRHHPRGLYQSDRSFIRRTVGPLTVEHLRELGLAR